MSGGEILEFASFEHLRGLRDAGGRSLGEVKAPPNDPDAAERLERLFERGAPAA